MITIETTTAWAPDHWASYLVNGDASGLDAHDKALADSWLARQAADGWQVACTGDGETAFMRHHDASFLGVLPTTCVEYILQRVVNQ